MQDPFAPGRRFRARKADAERACGILDSPMLDELLDECLSFSLCHTRQMRRRSAAGLQQLPPAALVCRLPRLEVFAASLTALRNTSNPKTPFAAAKMLRATFPTHDVAGVIVASQWDEQACTSD